MKTIQFKLAAIVPVSILVLALAATQSRAQNHVVNGSFEMPAYPGNGDIYGTDPGFALPGWSYSSNVFVEYGIHVFDVFPPRSQVRYADGRQALCLNDYGLGGAHINQLVPVTQGRNYQLSFAQADASMAAGTVSEVTVNLRLGLNADPLYRTFSRTNDGQGYTVKTWHFTAGPISPSVNLIFNNTTTNGLPEISPFLDAISVLPGSVEVVGFTHGVPGGTGTFGQLPRGPGVWGSNLVFFGAAAGGQQGIYGINNWPGDPMVPSDPYKIADLNTPIPGGSGNFTSFTGSGGAPPDPMISGSNVVFWATGANGQQGIYAHPQDPLHPIDPLRIADLNTPVPGGSLGNFTAFTANPAYPPDPCISGNKVAFYGAGAGVTGIYTATLGGALTRIADTTTLTPGTVNNHFMGFYTIVRADPSVSGNNVAFCGYSGNGSNGTTAGVYLSTDGVLSRVADTNTLLPGGTGYFGKFQTGDTSPGGPQVSGDNVLFWNRNATGDGLYVKTPQDPIYPGDPIKLVANRQTPIPGGSGTFTAFSAMSLSWDTVAFVGLGAGGQQGIYVSWPVDPVGGIPQDPFKVIDLNDTLDGKTITSLNLSRTGLDRDRNLLAFGATFDDGTQGLYTLNVFTGLRITSIARTGPDLQLSFSSQIGNNYTVQSRADAASGSWRDLLTQIPGNGGIVQTTISNAFVAPQQFYRIKQEPAQ